MYLSFTLLLVATFAGAQSLLLGDTDQDGELTIADVTKSVNMILGKEVQQTLTLDPYRVDNSMVAGTWYASDGKSFTFNADGTTTYSGGTTYEFMPSQGNLVVYDAIGLPVKLLPVVKVTSDYLLIVNHSTGAFTRYTSTKADLSGTIGDRAYVDLGLPSGTLWATCNIGAENPEDYGDYFAWGETVPYGKEDRSNANNYATTGNYIKTNFDMSTYKYSNGSTITLTKYCYDSDYGYNGFADGKRELDLSDDAAYVNWGAGWRMPSLTQFEELVNSEYTTTEWTNVNGINGRLITSKKNGNSIFLPAAGYRGGTTLGYVGMYGYYWSRTLATEKPYYARYLYFVLYNNYAYYWSYRSEGTSVRPVRAL